MNSYVELNTGTASEIRSLGSLGGRARLAKWMPDNVNHHSFIPDEWSSIVTPK